MRRRLKWRQGRRVGGLFCWLLTLPAQLLLTLQAQLQEKKIKPVLNRTVVALDS
jgi:hypothetical protein